MPPVRFATVADVLDRFGVPAWRVCADPMPGRAIVKDVVRVECRTKYTHELFDGTLIRAVGTCVTAYLGAELVGRLAAFTEAHDLGFLFGPRGTVEIAPGVVVSPSIGFVPWDQRPDGTVPFEAVPKLVPTLVVELLCPGRTRREIRHKIGVYFRHGTRRVWVIDPDTEAAEVYTSPTAKTAVPPAGTLDGGDVLPGFRLPLAKLFERLAKPAPKKPAAKKPRKKK